MPDLNKVKSNIMRVEEQLLVNKKFVSEVLAIKADFGKLAPLILNE
jgi:hypothetical protein